MDNNCDYLFVYGSLLNADNFYARYLKENSHPVAEGSFNGLLYDIGEYPGAIFNHMSDKRVYGTVVKLNNVSNALKIIDQYEGFGPTEEQPNLFVRQILVIDTPTGPLNCWVYLYNLPVTGFKLIPSGKYHTQ